MRLRHRDRMSRIALDGFAQPRQPARAAFRQGDPQRLGVHVPVRPVHVVIGGRVERLPVIEDFMAEVDPETASPPILPRPRWLTGDEEIVLGPGEAAEFDVDFDVAR